MENNYSRVAVGYSQYWPLDGGRTTKFKTVTLLLENVDLKAYIHKALINYHRGNSCIFILWQGFKVYDSVSVKNNNI